MVELLGGHGLVADLAPSAYCRVRRHAGARPRPVRGVAERPSCWAAHRAADSRRRSCATGSWPNPTTSGRPHHAALLHRPTVRQLERVGCLAEDVYAKPASRGWSPAAGPRSGSPRASCGA